jgi:hypothetical protein
MNTQNAFGSTSSSAPQAARDAEATLRLIAGLPAPEGLEERVIAGLRSGPRSGRVLSWPRLLNPTESLLRSAAAAAIVFVVVGGGWGVYSRVQPISAIMAPPSTGTAGAFSNAGAVRVPQTVPAPVVIQPAPIQSPVAEPVQSPVTEPAQKVGSKATAVPHRNAKPATAGKASVQPSPVSVSNKR